MLRLTKPQRLIYDMEKFHGGSISVICGSIVTKTKCPGDVLTAAVNEIFRLNDALRIRVVETESGPMQVIKEYVQREVKVLHFESKTALDAYANQYAKAPIDLYGPLCELTPFQLPEGCGMLAKLHHIVGDAWTLALLCSQFNALLSGKTPETYSYTGYLEREDDYLQSGRYEKDRAYFLERFQTCDEATFLSEKRSERPTAHRKTYVIGPAQAQQLSTYAKRHNASAFSVFMTAAAVYLSRVRMNAEKFYIGTAVLNRAGKREKNTAGMFINTVPLLIRLDNTKTFGENLEGIQSASFEAFRHQKYNYGDQLSALRQEYGFNGQLYDVMVSYQNAAIAGETAGFESTWYHSGAQAESLQIHIDDRDGEGIFRIHFDYQIEKFTEAEINAAYTHMMNLLFDAVEHENIPIRKLEMVSSAELCKLLVDFNDTAVEYPREKCVHQLFEEQVEKYPDKTALVACDCTLTYRELNEAANRIAHGLIAKGVRPGDIVAFALHRTSRLIAAMFGILKAGAAYLPIDLDYPQERIDYMLSDSGSKLLLTDEVVAKLLENEGTANPAVTMTSESLCYCIYTSGSTGKPKGTLLTHRGIVNLTTNLKIYKDLSSCRTIGFMTTIVFDVATQEIFTALLNGFTGVLLPERRETSAEEILKALACKNVDVIYATPSYFNALTDSVEKANALLKSVKVVALAGEAFYLNQYVMDCKDSNHVIFENQYGPVELHVIATATTLQGNDFVSIGKPVGNDQAYIVDKHLHPVPVGVTGELCIAGDGVGAGYLNRPELTAEKFIDNPFGPGKLYKTGDLAYWREDGNIVYVGRSDFQVKVRGLRIELGEIETAISAMDGISQAVVVVRKDDAGRQFICAFYTETKPVPVEQIKSALREKLPRYMTPHVFTRLDTLPMTPSGKIDRKSLPEVDFTVLQSEVEYVAPTTPEEAVLTNTIQAVLSVERVGLLDNFFDLGGDSLKAIEFISKAHSEGIYLALQSVFDHPTVSGLARVIREGDRPALSFADVDFSEVNRILVKNRLEGCTMPQEMEVGNLLLAGATGFLGIHILRDFLEHDSGMAYCLVRGKDQVDSETRMADLLRFYFEEKYIGCDRIRVLRTDLLEERFGLTKEDYGALCRTVDTVVNAAASVKHYGSYQYFKEANVDTTERLIRFCQESGAKLLHISTLSVSGNSFDTFDGYVSEEEKHFYERDLYIGQPLNNVYARSKFEAERAVLEAMGKGLRANIFRMGNLTSRLSDGVFQKNYETNAFLKRVKALLELGIVPDYLMPYYVEFTPIDEAAAAIMTIARHFSNEQTVFHINSTKVFYMEPLIGYCRELGYPMEVVSGEEFTVALRKTMGQSEFEHIFETFINDLDANDQLAYDSRIRIENSFTEQYLERLGFQWAETGLEYLRKYTDYFKRIGYWNYRQH